MLKNNAILSKLATGGPRLIPKRWQLYNILKYNYSVSRNMLYMFTDITPQCLMIHVKQPDNNLAVKKKLNTNISIESNVKQHYECDEEGLDIFQHTKGINFSYFKF